ncbi:Uncharacterised protein [Vibrio cholerae]|nr:Uncharacterised protein [Vibrio cholerae]
MANTRCTRCMCSLTSRCKLGQSANPIAIERRN